MVLLTYWICVEGYSRLLWALFLKDLTPDHFCCWCFSDHQKRKYSGVLTVKKIAEKVQVDNDIYI